MTQARIWTPICALRIAGHRVRGITASVFTPRSAPGERFRWALLAFRRLPSNANAQPRRAEAARGGWSALSGIPRLQRAIRVSGYSRLLELASPSAAPVRAGNEFSVHSSNDPGGQVAVPLLLRHSGARVHLFSAAGDRRANDLRSPPDCRARRRRGAGRGRVNSAVRRCARGGL